MRDAVPDGWLHPGTLFRARVLQQELAALVSQADEPAPPRLVAGADVSTAPRDPAAPVHAGVVLLHAPDLRVAGVAGATAVPDFAYVPGFLGFREVPVLVDAIRRLPAPPELILVDGHGLAHPRGFGIASHLGVVLDVATIGVAKSVLVGALAAPLGEAPGSAAPLDWRGRTVAVALRTRPRANPVFVSVGHRVSLDGAVRHVAALLRGRRLPEPTRLAHDAANRQRLGQL